MANPIVIRVKKRNFQINVAKPGTVSPTQYLREVDAISWTVVAAYVYSVITSPTMTWYKEGSSTDLSTTYLTGSLSVSGINAINTKTTQALKRGVYVVCVGGLVGSPAGAANQTITTFKVVVNRAGNITYRQTETGRRLR